MLARLAMQHRLARLGRGWNLILERTSLQGAYHLKQPLTCPTLNIQHFTAYHQHLIHGNHPLYRYHQQFLNINNAWPGTGLQLLTCSERPLSIIFNGSSQQCVRFVRDLCNFFMVNFATICGSDLVQVSLKFGQCVLGCCNSSKVMLRSPNDIAIY